MDNQILQTSKFGFVEKTNTSNFEVWSLVKWFFQLWYSGLGENISNSGMWVWARWNVFSFEIWVSMDYSLKSGCDAGKQIFPMLSFVFWGQQHFFATFAPLGPAGAPLPSNFHDLKLSFILFLRFHVFSKRFQCYLKGCAFCQPAPHHGGSPHLAARTLPPWQPFLKHLPP